MTFRLLILSLLIASAAAADGFVTRVGTDLRLDGRTWHFSGTNCYYVSYKPQAMVDAVLEDAVAMGQRVVRIWGFIDRGALDGTGNIDGVGHKDGVYFQYWDPVAGKPAYNDGVDGLQRLDYVVHRAEQLGLKVVIVLTNNWRDFGGMDQYLAWYGKTYHDQFYSDATIKQAFKDWIDHLTARANVYTGRVYRDEPAIAAWELANEPRCRNGGPRDRTTGWTSATLTTWAQEMARHLKSRDPNHLVAVGDEGFYANTARSSWPYRVSDGVDHAALLAIPEVDFGTYHLYPDHWGQTVAWGTTWIADHLALGRAAGKPTVLEEYGLRDATSDQAARTSAYTAWNDAVLNGGGVGAEFWMLAGSDGAGGVYPDYDGFTIYRNGPAAALLTAKAAAFAARDNHTPVAALAATPTSGGAPLSVAFSANGSSDADGDALTFAWAFGDGATASGISTTHTYARGSWTAVLTVTDARGAVATATAIVNASNAAPTVSLAGTPSSGYAPLAVTFLATGADGDGDALVYAWTFGDGSTGTGANPGHTYSAAGTYLVTVRVDDGFGGIASAQMTIAVAAAPTPVPVARINFQPVKSPVMPGWLVDGGALYGVRGGLSYGWSASISTSARDRNSTQSPDQRYDTLLQTQLKGSPTWNLAVENGTYRVRIVCGDPSFIDSVYVVAIEGVEALRATPITASRWAEGTATVEVVDGKLTMTSGIGARNNKVCFIEVDRLPVPVAPVAAQ